MWRQKGEGCPIIKCVYLVEIRVWGRFAGYVIDHAEEFVKIPDGNRKQSKMEGICPQFAQHLHNEWP